MAEWLSAPAAAMAAPQLSEDIRWLIVFKHVYQGLSHNDIIKHLSAGPVQITRRQISRALALYASSGDVMPTPPAAAARAATRAPTPASR